MPHGGGHVSHHGGGGGGGSHHHHHHHSFGGHHHQSYGGVVYTGGGGPYYYSRYRGWIWGIVGIVLIVAIVVTITLSVNYARKEDEENKYSPGDTRIHKFNTFFCSGVEVSSSKSFSNDGYVYLLADKPPLTSHNNFSIDDNFTLSEDDYHYWHFYLYPNSNISLKACVSDRNSYTFYIIKGTSQWNDWKDYASNSKSVHHAIIQQSCRLGNQSLQYKVNHEDHYYLAYYNDGINTVKGKQSLNMERFEYSFQSLSTVPNCSFSGPTTGSSCKLTTKMFSSKNKALLVIPEPPHDSDWENYYTINVDCIARVEGYVIVTVPPFVLIVGIVTCVILVLVCYRSMKKRKYQPLLASTNYPSTKSTVPPPFDPTHEGDPPSYKP